MKVLVISLLRLGDGIMISPCLKGLKQKYPDADLHILLNRECESLRELLPAVDKFHYFERKSIQSSMGEAQRGLFEAYDRVKELTQRLSEQKYDLVVNLTQNKLSGYIMSSIEAKDKVGLSLASNSWVSFGSPWFRYLNVNSGSRYDGVFHFTDICYHGTGLSEIKHPYSLLDTKKYQFQKKSTGPVVFVQAFTSDTKKTWFKDAWVESFQEFQKLYPDADVRILAAPAEVDEANKLVDSLVKLGVQAELLSLSLADTFTALKSADLLVSLDTSIKHLAAAAHCKILEVSLGSSDVNFTGSYSENSLMIQAKIECSPCRHSEPCSQMSHLCGKSIDPNVIGACMGFLLEANWLSLKEIAKEYDDKLYFWRSKISKQGFWYRQSLTEPIGELVSRILNIMSWQLVLDNDHLDPLASFGSVALKLKDEMKRLNADPKAFNAYKQKLELQDLGFLSALDKLHNITKNSFQGKVDWKAVFDELKFNVAIQNHFHKLSQDYSSDDIFGLRQVQSHLNLWSAQTQAQVKILKALEGHIPEVLA